MEDFEELVGVHSPNMVLFDKLLKGRATKVCEALGIEEELEELAEKRVEGFVLWCERDKVRPASNNELSYLRAEGDMIFDELVAGAQEPAHGNDFRWRKF